MDEAHPRSRGENFAIFLCLITPAGSSPLTRGKRVRQRPRVTRDGLIPAHAGKTQGHADVFSHARAHPRSRGENMRTGYQYVGRWGSSPLTRGKQLLQTDVHR